MKKDIDETIANHFSKSLTKHYKKDTILTLAGQEPLGVSLLIEGLVEQYDITPEGNKVTVNIFKPHAFFPMSWAINNTPNVYFYAALTDVAVKYAPAKDTVAFLRQHPDTLLDLMSRVYKGTDALLRRLVIATSGIASSRLIFELLIEAYRFGNDTLKNGKIIQIKQTQLAARSGLSRETVSRELHKLEQDKLIRLTKQGIIIDMENLEKRLDITL